MNQLRDLLGEQGVKHEGPVLFIAEVRNRLEKRLLENCLAEAGPPGAGESAVDKVFLPVSRADSLPDLQELVAKMGAPEDTLLVPLRIAWLMPESDDSGIKPL